MYLLDTDICIQFMKNEGKVVSFIRRLDNPSISIITLAELFYGIYNLKNAEKHKKALADFLSGVSILNAEFSVANNFGRIKSILKNKGKLSGDFDILNAAFALTYGLTLITRNLSHYYNIEGVNAMSV